MAIINRNYYSILFFYKKINGDDAYVNAQSSLHSQKIIDSHGDDQPMHNAHKASLGYFD